MDDAGGGSLRRKFLLSRMARDDLRVRDSLLYGRSVATPSENVAGESA